MGFRVWGVGSYPVLVAEHVHERPREQLSLDAFGSAVGVHQLRGQAPAREHRLGEGA